MNTPTESGWYWADFYGTWEVVFVRPNMRVNVIGRLKLFNLSDFVEWGERIERKDDIGPRIQPPDVQPTTKTN